MLNAIISEHLKQARPVGSALLKKSGCLNVSAATIRNEMAELEKNGYIAQPYTSAGRVPTEKGYGYFLSRYLEAKISSKNAQDLKIYIDSLNISRPEESIKALCKKLACLSDGAVMVSFSDNSFYYTGLSNLFAQPEMADPEVICDLGSVIDHLDKKMADLFDKINQTEVYIGSENPFGQDLSAILTKWKLKNSGGLLGILGPIRMDYEKNISLINYIKDNLI